MAIKVEFIDNFKNKVQPTYPCLKFHKHTNSIALFVKANNALILSGNNGSEVGTYREILLESEWTKYEEQIAIKNY